MEDLKRAKLKEHCDDLVRAHVAFPLFGLVIKAKEYISIKLAYSSLAISKGKARGSVRFSRRATDGSKDVILFAEEVGEDEEVPSNVKGIVVEKDVSLLSYIRVRRSGAVSAVCKNHNFKKLKDIASEGNRFELVITSESITLTPLNAHDNSNLYGQH